MKTSIEIDINSVQVEQFYYSFSFYIKMNNNLVLDSIHTEDVSHYVEGQLNRTEGMLQEEKKSIEERYALITVLEKLIKQIKYP